LLEDNIPSNPFIHTDTKKRRGGKGRKKRMDRSPPLKKEETKER
jgi:hypothetical protein